MEQENLLSNFWMDRDSDLSDFGIVPTQSEQRSTDLFRLASCRRAIANFVQIVSGKAIPVKFVEKGITATDNKIVQISATVGDKNFDPIALIFYKHPIKGTQKSEKHQRIRRRPFSAAPSYDG